MFQVNESSAGYRPGNPLGSMFEATTTVPNQTTTGVGGSGGGGGGGGPGVNSVPEVVYRTTNSLSSIAEEDRRTTHTTTPGGTSTSGYNSKTPVDHYHVIKSPYPPTSSAQTPPANHQSPTVYRSIHSISNAG